MSSDNRELLKEIREREKNDYASTLTNIVTAFGSLALSYYLDIPTTLIYDQDISRFYLNIAFLLLFVVITIGIFLICYVTYYRKICTEDWEYRYPHLIPLATGCFVFSFLMFNVALWPRWSLLTPVITFIMLTGIVSLVALLPNDGSSSLTKSIHVD